MNSCLFVNLERNGQSCLVEEPFVVVYLGFAPQSSATRLFNSILTLFLGVNFKMVLTSVLSMIRYVSGVEERDFVDRLHSFFTTNLLVALSVLVRYDF
jgi:hypothetical protein